MVFEKKPDKSFEFKMTQGGIFNLKIWRGLNREDPLIYTYSEF